MEERRLDTPAMRRISEILSLEFPSDITIQVGEATFNLHKLPLASRCGYIREQVSGINGSRVTHIDITGLPGGAAAFELVTKFCYGENFELTEDNVAMLRCAAEHLQMTDDDSRGGNLAGRTEAYLEAVALMSLAGAVTVLRRSEDLLPVSEEVDLVGRCVDAIAYFTCNDSQFSMSNGNGMDVSSSKVIIDDWLADELTSLRIDTFQRVVIAMKARGFKGIALGTLIMLYAQKSLRTLDTHGREKQKMEPRQEHEKRVVLETIVTLLPKERNSMSVSFLSMLLRAALCLDTTLACRLDLEKRMAAQLGQAVLDDLLIPIFLPDAGNTFDVDAVQRILVGYLEHEAEADRLDYNTDDDFTSTASPPNDVGMVGKLMESYLAEIASDVDLPVDKFTGLAEMIPERARFNDDGMYRSIDIYLKAHPYLSEAERKTVCRVMDCQKLSREACAHAAQNNRLPVQTVVQVLHHEQRRLREAPTSSFYGGESPTPAPSLQGRHGRSVPDEMSQLQRENEELKMELLRLKMNLRDPSAPPQHSDAPPSGRRPLPKKAAGGSGGFINNVSKKLGRLNPFLRPDAVGGAKVRTKPSRTKDRRHSIG
uniref:BTB/POZ domain-containing protein n=1 Tax=Zea mays TaxID=4577 RepID=A0A804LFC6_MAIZE